MGNTILKSNFLKNDYATILSHLDVNTQRKWGKMNVQQMIEHMSDYLRIANGKTILSIVTPSDDLPKMQAFLMSEKPFRENTPNMLMPDTPPAIKNNSKEKAIEELKQELDYFFEVYKNEPDKQTPNPFFGYLNFEMQVQLLHKHATHHLRQFGVEI